MDNAISEYQKLQDQIVEVQQSAAKAQQTLQAAQQQLPNLNMRLALLEGWIGRQPPAEIQDDSMAPARDVMEPQIQEPK